MIRFAANIGFLFPEHDFLDRFRAARDSGFGAVEFAAPYAYPPIELAGHLKDHGLECVLFNLPMGRNLSGPLHSPACHPERVDEFREDVEQALEYAAALGNKRINCIAGTVKEGDDLALCKATLHENLCYAADKLATAGLELVLEPINTHDVPGFIVSTAAHGSQIVAQVGAANFGLQFDIYHTAMMGDEPSSTLERHIGIVRHIQFADAPGRGEPGTGNVQMQQHFDTIERLGYDGWVSAEYKPTKPTVDTLDWLRRTS